jgi:uncharacterized membrane protein YfcA
VDELTIEIVTGLAIGAGMGIVGAGGAIFTVPVFGMMLGHDPKSAFVEALAVTGVIAFGSAFSAAVRRQVDWRRVALFGAAGIAGTQAIAPVAVRMPVRLQVALFALVAFYAAARMWASAGASETAKEVDARRTAFGTFLAGFMIGMLTGTLGVGGGFLLVPALAVYEGLPMRRAVGTSVVVIVINASAGLAGQWWSGGLSQVTFDQRAVAITGICGVVGSVGGAMVASRIPQRGLRRVFAALLVSASAWLVVQQFLLRGVAEK